MNPRKLERRRMACSQPTQPDTMDDLFDTNENNFPLAMLQFAVRNEPGNLSDAMQKALEYERASPSDVALALHAAIAARATECIQVIMDLLPEDLLNVLDFKYGKKGE